VTNADATPTRKGLRVGRVSERAGINAVRGLLEKHGLVVDEVDGRADYGRDLNVDITVKGRITGGIIGVQVKSGASHFRRGRWIIPATPVDWEYWRSSTVPVIGMVYDPATDTIRWRNLSRAARARVDPDDGFDPEPQSDDASEAVMTEVLDDASFGDFLNQTLAYLSATADSAFLSLFEASDESRRRGVFNCWTLGRHDPRPLMLLRHVLPTLGGRSFLDAVQVLAHATSHPDIFWTRQNWISPPVEEAVKRSFRWSADEVVGLVHKFETMDEVGADWYRGGMGQNLWSIMVADRGLQQTLPEAIRHAADSGCERAAVRLLIWFQYLTPEPQVDVAGLVAAIPRLSEMEEVGWVTDEVQRVGRFEVFA
jgi:hypothetical protein